MNFNLYFKLKGPAGEDELPNVGNPVQAEDMRQCLYLIATNLPEFGFGLKVTGVRIELDNTREPLERGRFYTYDTGSAEESV